MLSPLSRIMKTNSKKKMRKDWPEFVPLKTNSGLRNKTVCTHNFLEISSIPMNIGYLVNLCYIWSIFRVVQLSCNMGLKRFNELGTRKWICFQNAITIQVGGRTVFSWVPAMHIKKDILFQIKTSRFWHCSSKTKQQAFVN